MATDLNDAINKLAHLVGWVALTNPNLDLLKPAQKAMAALRGLATPAPSSRISGDAPGTSYGVRWSNSGYLAYTKPEGRSLGPSEVESLLNAAGVSCTMPEGEALRFFPATNKQLYDALVEWYQLSDGITVGIPSELVKALLEVLSALPKGQDDMPGVPCTMPEGEAVAVRYRNRCGRWQYLNYPYTKGWDFPPNLGTPIPLYEHPPARDVAAPDLMQRVIAHLEAQALYTPSDRNRDSLQQILTELRAHVGAKGRRGQDCEGKTGEPFFTVKNIKLATMTPEQEAAAQQGWCMKCAQPSLSEKHQEDGMRWLQCSHCKTVYALGDCEGNGQGDPNGRS